jgi:hypothetical protein
VNARRASSIEKLSRERGAPHERAAKETEIRRTVRRLGVGEPHLDRVERAVHRAPAQFQDHRDPRILEVPGHGGIAGERAEHEVHARIALDQLVVHARIHQALEAVQPSQRREQRVAGVEGNTEELQVEQAEVLRRLQPETGLAERLREPARCIDQRQQRVAGDAFVHRVRIEPGDREDRGHVDSMRGAESPDDPSERGEHRISHCSKPPRVL